MLLTGLILDILNFVWQGAVLYSTYNSLQHIWRRDPKMEAGFAQIHCEMATKNDLEDVKQELRQEFKTDITEAKNDLKDHISREVSKMRDNDYRQNEKTNEFVAVAYKSGIISKKDAERLFAINPLAVPVR